MAIGKNIVCVNSRFPITLKEKAPRDQHYGA